MGIKGLNSFIDKKYPNSLKSGNIKELKGKKIAIDTNYLMNIHMSHAQNEVLDAIDDPLTENIDSFVRRRIAIKMIIEEFVIPILRYGIYPIFVFDGEKRKLKVETVEKRKKKTTNSYEKLKKEREYSKSLTDPIDIITSRDKAKKIMRYCYHVSETDMIHLYNIFQELGLNPLKAAYDGEKLCCSLTIEGQAEAVYSKDSDCLPLGSPKTIKSLITRGGYMKYYCIETILEELDMSFSMFRAFCIMCGTDFNDNMTRVGPATAYKLIKKHRRIKYFPDKYPTEVLNYEAVKEIFKYEKSDAITVMGDCVSLFPDMSKLDQAKPECSIYGVSSLSEKIFQLYDELPSSIYSK